MSSEFKKILTHSIIYGVGNILQKMIGFFMIPIYTHAFSRADYGLIDLLENTIIVIQLIVGMSLATALLRFYTEDSRKEHREAVISTSMLFVIVVSGLVCILGCVLSPQISRLIVRRVGYAEAFRVMMFVFLFNSMIEIPLVVLRAREKSLVYLGVSIGRFMLACVLNILFIVVLHKGVAGWLLSSLWTSIILCSYLVVSTFSNVEKIRFSWPLLKRMIRYTLPLVPAGLAMFWIHNGDRYILNEAHGLSNLGLYSLGYKFGMMITYLVGQPFFLIWSVRMYEVFEQPGGERNYARAFTYFTAVVMQFLLLLSVTIRDVVSVMTDPKFHDAYLVVPFVALAYALREASDFFKGVLLIERRTSFIGLVTLGAALLITVLYLLLIPPYGQWGAAGATVITFGSMAAFMFITAQAVHKVPYEYARLGLMVGLALVMILSIQWIHINQLYADIFLKSILSFTFFPFLYLLGFFTRGEKDQINRGFARIFGLFRAGNGNGHGMD